MKSYVALRAVVRLILLPSTSSCSSTAPAGSGYRDHWGTRSRHDTSNGSAGQRLRCGGECVVECVGALVVELVWQRNSRHIPWRLLATSMPYSCRSCTQVNASMADEERNKIRGYTCGGLGGLPVYCMLVPCPLTAWHAALCSGLVVSTVSAASVGGSAPCDLNLFVPYCCTMHVWYPCFGWRWCYAVVITDSWRLGNEQALLHAWRLCCMLQEMALSHQPKWYALLLFMCAQSLHVLSAASPYAFVADPVLTYLQPRIVS